MLGKVRGRILFRHLSSVLTRAPIPKGEGFPSLFEAVDSATPDKPFVQNDILEAMRTDSQGSVTEWKFYELKLLPSATPVTLRKRRKDDRKCAMILPKSLVCDRCTAR